MGDSYRISTDHAVKVEPESGLLLLNGKPYRGTGVVPRELPPEHYALANLGKSKLDGYDLLPTTSDQVYGGYEAEHPVSNQAVDGTPGMVLKYGGKFVDAVFHSTSGGYTASSEEVWNSEPVPYLRGGPDAQRGQAPEHVPSLEVFKRHANPTALRSQSLPAPARA